MIFTEPVTFEEALAYAREKQILPTSLSSAELRELHAQLKQRAVFSANMTLADWLSNLQGQIELIAGGGEDEHGRIRSIPEAKAQLLKSLQRLGYQPKEGEEGTIKDFTSDRRLQLVVETNALDVMGAGRYESDTEEEALDVNPGWRLVRMVQPLTKARDWPTRWDAAGAAVGWKGAAQAEMVALKNSPIWQALGNGAGGYKDTLGNPWAPFAFHSGMNTIAEPRSECERLGLLSPGERIAAPAKRDLNESLKASVAQFSSELQHALAQDPELEVAGGVLRIRGARPSSANARARVSVFLELAKEAA